MSLVTDRLHALVGLVGVSFIVWYWQFDTAGRSVGCQIAILAAIVATGAAFVLWLMPALTQSLAKRWPALRRLHELVAIVRFTALSRAGAAGLLLSCVVVALTVNAVVLFAHGFGVALAPPEAYLVVPIAILFSSLPNFDWRLARARGKPLLRPHPVWTESRRCRVAGLSARRRMFARVLARRHRDADAGGQAWPAFHRAGSGLIE
jgi:hypothetical protein